MRNDVLSRRWQPLEPVRFAAPVSASRTPDDGARRRALRILSQVHRWIKTSENWRLRREERMCRGGRLAESGHPSGSAVTDLDGRRP